MVTKKSPSVAYTILGLASLFGGFLIRLGMAFITSTFNIGDAVVSVVLFGAGVGVVFIGALPVINFKFSGVLGELQSGEINAESQLSASEVATLQNILPALEGIVSSMATKAAGDINSAAVKEPEKK